MRDAIHLLDTHGGFAVPAGELSIAVLDAQAMGRLHAAFLDDPAPTDVITFDGDPHLGEAGEICVCPEVAQEYVSEHGGEFSRELVLYIAHGYLHLAGYDDTRPALKRAMRRAERRAMDVLETAQLPLESVAAWR